MTSKKTNAPLGSAEITKLAGGVKAKKKVFFCGSKHTSKLRKELDKAGLALSNTSGQTQRETLLRVLQYRGPRGLNTPEGVALGYYRIATRVQELEERGWVIASLRENIIGEDGHQHVGMARYVLMGREPKPNPQHTLDLGV